MILLHQISGIADAVPAGQAFLYVGATGIPSVKHSDGSVGLLQQGTVGVSGLIDQLGTFASGHAPGWDGTNFRQMSLVGAQTDTMTIIASGTVIISRVLGSGSFANGTSGYVTFSGIDQTYDILEIYGETRVSLTQGMVLTTMYFNNDHTDGNYLCRRTQSDPAFNQSQAADVPYIGNSIGQPGLGAGNYRAANHFIIPDYTSVGPRKWAYSLGSSAYNDGGVNTQEGVDTFAIQWENTSGPAITMIELGANDGTASMTSGTIYTLIGHKRLTVITSGTYGPGRMAYGRMVPA